MQKLTEKEKWYLHNTLHTTYSYCSICLGVSGVDSSTQQEVTDEKMNTLKSKNL